MAVKNELGAAERGVLRRLAAGGTLVEDTARGGWRVGAHRCTYRSVDLLLRCDLIEKAGAGYRISGPGMAHVQRLAAPDAPNRLIESTAELPRHRGAAMRGARQANRAEEPLAWLLARGHVSERQYAAGERLRGDFLMAGEAPQITMRWDAGPVTKGRKGPAEALSRTEAQMAAKRRLQGALEAAGGGLSDVLMRTVCLGEGLETAERAMGWPARSGKVVLCLGLDRVAGFYRV